MTQRRDDLVKKAVKIRKNVVKLYQDKRKAIKQNRLNAREARIKDKEAKELSLVSQTIANTEAVLKTCGFICKNVEDVDKLTENQQDELTKKEALLSQIKYYKCVNRGIVKGWLFFYYVWRETDIHTTAHNKTERNYKSVECTM